VRTVGRQKQAGHLAKEVAEQVALQTRVEVCFGLLNPEQSGDYMVGTPSESEPFQQER
jgi:hypothetical protein